MVRHVFLAIRDLAKEIQDQNRKQKTYFLVSEIHIKWFVLNNIQSRVHYVKSRSNVKGHISLLLRLQSKRSEPQCRVALIQAPIRKTHKKLTVSLSVETILCNCFYFKCNWGRGKISQNQTGESGYTAEKLFKNRYSAIFKRSC